MNRLKRFMFNGILITLVALSVRFAALFLNVIITRRLGAGGMGLLSLVNSVFGFAVTFSTGGVSLAATRLCAEAFAKNDPQYLKRSLRWCMGYALLLGIAAAVFLVLLADYIAATLLTVAEVASSLRILSVSMPIFSLSAVIGGYFTAAGRAWKNALGAVCEQAVKMAAVMLLFSLFRTDSDAASCFLVIAATVAAELISGVFTYCLYRPDRNRACGAEGGAGLTFGAGKMLSIALPVALSSYIRSALVTFEHMLIPRGLTRAGAGAERALATYGVVQGMAFPVIFFPTSLLYSFTGLVIPEMTIAQKNDERAQIRRICEKVMHFSLMFAFGCAGVLFVFADCLGASLYHNAEAGVFIRVMAPLIPVMYFDSAVDALLKGLGEHVYTMKVNVADALISLVLVALLVPKCGIGGYIFVVYVSECINVAFSLWRLYRVAGVLPSLLRSMTLPLLGIMFFLPLGHPDLSGFLILRFLLAIFMYLLFLCLCGCIGKEERQLFCKTFLGE